MTRRYILLLTGLIGCLGLAHAGFLVVVGGQAKCQIVLGAGAQPVEKDAAQDLARCLKLMTGVEVPLVAEGQEQAGVRPNVIAQWFTHYQDATVGAVTELAARHAEAATRAAVLDELKGADTETLRRAHRGEGDGLPNLLGNDSFESTDNTTSDGPAGPVGAPGECRDGAGGRGPGRDPAGGL